MLIKCQKCRFNWFFLHYLSLRVITASITRIAWIWRRKLFSSRVSRLSLPKKSRITKNTPWAVFPTRICCWRTRTLTLITTMTSLSWRTTRLSKSWPCSSRSLMTISCVLIRPLLTRIVAARPMMLLSTLICRLLSFLIVISYTIRVCQYNEKN